MFARVKPIEAILLSAERKPLHRSLGAFQLTMLGVGAIVGTGIFVLTAQAAQKAGPAMTISFVIAAVVCVVAALCYAELASMIPVSGSAYTYTYAVLGELLAWLVGWALIAEYALAASAVAAGWSGYVVGLIDTLGLFEFPRSLTRVPVDGGLIDLPAFSISLLVTVLLVIGTRESARFNAVLVLVKIAALALFLVLTVPVINLSHFVPFAPAGFVGISGAAASIFFAFVGFDAVAAAAEETVNPQRNMPIGIIGSLAVCTVLYLLVAAGVTGTIGTQPILGSNGDPLPAGGAALSQVCSTLGAQAPLVCSREPLAYVLKSIGSPQAANLLGLAAGFALPSVILLMIFAQTRVSFVMARDGLLPEPLSRVHKRFRTPHIITLITGTVVACCAGFVPLGKLADLSNSGTLFAFFMVSIAVVVLRRRDPGRVRPFRAPTIWLVAPAAGAGCAYLFLSLSVMTQQLMGIWMVIGLVVYALYGYRRSHVAKGVIEAATAPDSILKTD